MRQFNVEKVAVYDKIGQRIAMLDAGQFPRTSLGDDKGVPILAVNDGLYEVPLPGGGTGWITKASGITSTPPCRGPGVPKSTINRGGYVSRGAGAEAC